MANIRNVEKFFLFSNIALIKTNKKETGYFGFYSSLFEIYRMVIK